MFTLGYNLKNMNNCPHYKSCSQNLCPLDHDLQKRHGLGGDKCRYMRNARQTKIKGKEFISGGTVMPDVLLNLVPRSNLKCLNEPSKNRWPEINGQNINRAQSQSP